MDYIYHMITWLFIYMLLAESMNLYLGYTGVLALSHVAFFGIGAYSGALISLSVGSFWLGFLIGGLIAGLLGFLLGLTSIKLRADYLGIATLGFAQIVHTFFQNSDLTRGPLGLPGIPRPSVFGLQLTEKFHYMIFAGVITFILMAFMYRVVKSPFGQILETIRDDEIAAKSLGKNTIHYKLIAFTIGAIIAAWAGTLMAHLVTYIDPMSFHTNSLAIILVMTVLGGLGTYRGPILGSIIIIALAEGVTFLNMPQQLCIPGIETCIPWNVGAVQMMLYSVLFLIIMVFLPQGIGGFWKHRKRRRRQFTRY
jgi:branched-chain amino acid transport system permease protein